MGEMFRRVGRAAVSLMCMTKSAPPEQQHAGCPGLVCAAFNGILESTVNLMKKFDR